MPLTFLVPALLAAVAAVAIPLLVHLTRRRSDRMVEFPSLMFVRRLPLEVERRRRFRDVLLLALRCAAIVLLALAFARPFLRRPAAASAAAAGGREVVILVDRSLSMGQPGRWDRARAGARQAIAGLSAGDRGTLILFDDEAAATVRSSREPALLRAALDGAVPGSGATRFVPALKLAESVLAGSALPRRELVLVSDFQRSGWEAEAGAESVHLPAGTAVTPISVADGARANLAVAGVTLARERLGGRERVTATARVVNQGPDPVPGAAVSLELDGRVLERRTVPVGASASAAVDFAPFTLSGGIARAVVRVEGDQLTADNDFHLVLSPGEAIGVLVIEGPAAPRDASLYLSRALALGGDPGFRLDVRRGGAPTAGELANHGVIVLNDAAAPEGEAGDRLRRWVETGGGLILLSGPGTARAGWGRTPLVRGVAGGAGREDATGGILGFVDYGHPIFEPFAAPRSGDVTAARFFRWRALVPGDSARVLARFGDGSAALAEARVGRGRVMAWGSTLDVSWNDLALQPVFLPFVHRLVTHAAGYSAPGAWLTAGEVIDAEPATLARAPSGATARLEPGVPLPLRERGFHELRGGRAGERLDRVVAVNPAARESELAVMDPAMVVAALAPPPGRAATLGADPIPAREQERSQAIWWWLLLFVMTALVAESLLAGRISGAAR